MEVLENGYWKLSEEEKERMREKARGRSLAEMNPELAAQWHKEKNGDLTAEMVTEHSNKKVWWIYPYDCPKTGHHDFVWSASPNNRAKAPGIPFLAPSPRAWAGFNDLETLRPDVAAQFHKTKNGNLKPTDLTPMSNKKVWWSVPVQKSDGTWITVERYESVADKAKKVNSTELSWKYVVIKGVNDLESFFPNLVQEWNFAKNGELTPDKIHKESEKKVWWILPYDDPITGKHFDFEWLASVCSRTVQGCGCPYLSGKSIWSGYNDLATLRPDLMKEWNFKNNLSIDPTKISAHSHKIVSWHLVYYDDKKKEWVDYYWTDSIHNRANGAGCPYLSGSRTERLIRDFLTDSNIAFKKEKSFPKCKRKGLLRFDIYLKEEPLLIEIDGLQHFEAIQHFGGHKSLTETKIRDNIKTNFCRNNNIPLLRIPYIYDSVKDKSKIEQFVLNFIQTKQVPQEILDFYAQFPFSDYGKIT
jgi:hypothetical protein